jgi:hypothetical protein
MLADIVQEAILAENLLPAENIGINSVLDADWDGTPRIIVSAGMTRDIETTQLNTLISQITELKISCLSANRGNAVSLGTSAADAVYNKLTALSYILGSGILFVKKISDSVFNIPDRTEFVFETNFEILNKLYFMHS